MNASTPHAFDVVGWTAPESTYEHMRQINVAAESLNADVEAHVADAPFHRGWNAWYDNWRRFYERYAGESPSTRARLGVLLHSDELARQTEAYRLELLSWYQSYTGQRDAAGRPVPPPTASAPASGAGANAGAGWGLPWWFWATVVVGTAAVGYSIYRSYERQREIGYGMRREFGKVPVLGAIARLASPTERERTDARKGRDQSTFGATTWPPPVRALLPSRGGDVARADRDCGCSHTTRRSR